MSNAIKAQIKSLLSREDNVGAIAITTAMVRLYARQTCDEQRAGTTNHHNGRGFNAFHAKDGTYMAKYALGASRQHPQGVISPDQWDAEVAKLRRGEATPIRIINGRFLVKARKMTLFYIAQLVAEAEAKYARDLQVEREALMSEAPATPDYEEEKDGIPPTLGSPRFPFPTSERKVAEVAVVWQR